MTNDSDPEMPDFESQQYVYQELLDDLEALADGWESDVGDLDVDDSFRRGQNRMRLLCVQELRSLIVEYRGERDD